MKPWPGLDLEISGDAELVKRVVYSFMIHDQMMLRKRFDDARVACEEAQRALALLKAMPWPEANHDKAA